MKWLLLQDNILHIERNRQGVNMSKLEHHEMRLEITHPTGAQEWFCPKCGQRFVMQLRPVFNIIDLDAGNKSVSHTGSIGNLRIDSSQVRPIEPEEAAFSDELRAALEEALEDVDLDDWLDDDDQES